jgi:hypothetical protein
MERQVSRRLRVEFAHIQRDRDAGRVHVESIFSRDTEPETATAATLEAG